jgi:prefoldin subunit 5
MNPEDERTVRSLRLRTTAIAKRQEGLRAELKRLNEAITSIEDKYREAARCNRPELNQTLRMG